MMKSPILLLTITLGLTLVLSAQAEQRRTLKDLPDPKEKVATPEDEPAFDPMSRKEKAQLVQEMAEEFFQMGSEALTQGNLEKAEGYFDRVLVLSPDHKGAREGIELIMKSYAPPQVATEPARPKPPVIKRREPVNRSEANEKVEEEEDIEKSNQLYVEALQANQTGNIEEARKLCQRSLSYNRGNLQAKRMLDRLNSKSAP
jgi:tetratricopeptide (TPR) repeat protein